jgi:hypothetical protein
LFEEFVRVLIVALLKYFFQVDIEYEKLQFKKWCKMAGGIQARRHKTNGHKTGA